MILLINDLETRRFGVTCARFNGRDTEFPDLADVEQTAKLLGVAIISTRIDASAMDRVHGLEANGYQLMDTLVYYGRSLQHVGASRQPPEGVTLRLATPGDAHSVECIAGAAFRGYFGHYHADPRLDNAGADAAYVEWAANSVAQASDTTPVLLALKAEEIIGFATLRFETPTESEVILNAVDPNHRGGGVYTSIIERALGLRKSEGLVEPSYQLK